MDWMLDGREREGAYRLGKDTYDKAHDVLGKRGAILNGRKAIAIAQYHRIREWLGGTCPHSPFTWRRQCDKCFAEFSKGG